jgi:hypothetical protein
VDRSEDSICSRVDLTAQPDHGLTSDVPRAQANNKTCQRTASIDAGAARRAALRTRLATAGRTFPAYELPTGRPDG